MLETKKFFIKTQGCQMNEYDSDKLGDILKHNLNMVETDKYEEISSFGTKKLLPTPGVDPRRISFYQHQE